MSFNDYKSFVDYMENSIEGVPFVLRSEGIEYHATLTNEGILYSLYDSKESFIQNHTEAERLFNQYFESGFELNVKYNDVNKCSLFMLPIIDMYLESTRPRHNFKEGIRGNKQNRPMGIGDLYSSIDEELDRLFNYLIEIERLINESIKKEDDEQLKQGAYRADLWIVSAEWSMFNGNYLYVSFLFLLFAVFENTIDIICEEISIKRKSNIRRKDLTGGLVNSSKKYLEEFGRFKRPNNEQWNVIRGIYDVRNTCIHGGGDLDKANIGSKKRINNLIKMIFHKVFPRVMRLNPSR